MGEGGTWRWWDMGDGRTWERVGHGRGGDMGEGGTWEGKRSGKWEKGNKKRKNGKVSTYMDSM